MSELYIRAENGLLMALGAKVRRYDPKEEKYRLTRTADVTGIDLSQPYSLLYVDKDNGNLWDPRPEVPNQGQKGACAAFAACYCAEICSWQQGGGQPVPLSGSELYERDRKLEEPGNWTTDSGSTLADNLDGAMAGLFSEADAPESDDLSRDYDAGLGDKQRYTYVAGHQPFYPGETSDPDFFIKAIAAAIAARQPVELGTAWFNPWFTPDAHGVLPLGSLGSAVGGHAFTAWAVLPILGGVVACTNQWTSQWNTQVGAVGYHLRPGDFLVPFAALRDRTPFFEGRAVTWQPVTPEPGPEPQPVSSCRDAALAAAQPIVDSLSAKHAANLRSTTYRFELQGAQAVRDAIAALPS